MIIQKIKNKVAYNEKFKVFMAIINFLRFVIKGLFFLTILSVVFISIVLISYFSNVGADGSGGLALLGVMALAIIPLFLLILAILALYCVKIISFIFNHFVGIKRYIAIQVFIMGIVIVALILNFIR